MGTKYVINGVQIGMLIALPTKEERLKFFRDVIEINYIKLPYTKILDNCILINHPINQEKIGKMSKSYSSEVNAKHHLKNLKRIAKNTRVSRTKVRFLK